MKDNNTEVVKEIKDAKENLSKVNKDVGKVKVVMSQMLEKFNQQKQTAISDQGNVQYT
ncbi:Hypothetical predicted protein [Paramuricea clavata]|uniref:Uncharacterized protein n=1 Tax=Paramuricea clavata TaxID=317549 RepID=A0A7D9EJ74_PARCT|nr:Hypothetical predicted protein [Paramuricea clavata]